MKSAGFRLILLAAAVAATLSQAGAQADRPAGGVADWRAELDAITAEIRLTDERQAELQAEMAALDRDRAGLNEVLIVTNQHIQELETQIDAAQQRMANLLTDEERLRASLFERRDVLAEVLAALQRMGRAPPPAILVQPGDALAAVRGAILLGAVVPELRAEAETLARDIDGLAALRAEQERERDRLVAGAVELAEESQRLELLILERQRSLNQSAETLRAEQDRAAALAAQAQNLEELIGAVGAQAPERALEVGAITPEALLPGVGPPVSFGEADRIRPAMPFDSARGRLPRPAAGELITAYGVDDGFGGRSAGISIATRPGARISSPTDGWVEFAAPYRSYGNLLIIDAGGGYRIVLAGMERVDVQAGQFVLAGEPVAAMEATRLAATGEQAMGTGRPVLYVEFRKDGASIDPGPWWADPY
jgi:septal ring factor EnvC (AmiA/AmiB activator)